MTSETEKSLYEDPKVWEQPLQDYQKNVLQAYIDYFPEDVKSVLDIGCGDGKITHALSEKFKGVSFHGFDKSYEALDRLKLPSTQGDVVNLPFQDNQFDLVMTVDLLEHLDDLEEQQCLKELFRVAKNWVFLTVPFNENLEEGLTKCDNCCEIYHVNYHKRSYSIGTILKKKIEGWSLSNIILSGIPSQGFHPLEITYRRHSLNEWNGWECAKCPKCNTKSRPPEQISVLDDKAVDLLGSVIYVEDHPYIKSHSEIIAVFSKNNSILPRKSGNLAMKLSKSAAVIDLLQDAISINLDPFPQTAKIVNSSDNHLVLQFPAYPSSLSQGVFNLQEIENSIPFEGKNLNNIIIEDSLGIIPYEYLNKSTIRTNRTIKPGYYGVIIRIPKNHNYKSIEFAGAPLRDFYIPSTKKGMNYYYINQKLVIQVPYMLQYKEESFFIENPALLLKKKRLLMLCHDQDIDRRILAQAQSLVNYGLEVTIIGLSKELEGFKEFSQNGITLIFIGLANIKPNNSAYLSYISRGNQIGDIISKYGVKLQRLHNINFLIYLAHLFLKYHNHKFHDPLPFFSAFYNECSSIAANYDLIQVHDLPALEAGIKIAKQYNIPIVYDAHELYPEQKTFSRVQKRLCFKHEKKLIKEVNHVFAVNESIAKLMQKRYKISKPTVLLNSLEYYNKSSQKNILLHEKLSLSEDKKILLFQGGFSYNRNLENLIKAFRYVRSKDVNLVLLGRGDIESELRAIAQKYTLLGTRVHFLAAVPQHELLKYTCSATMGIIPYPHVDLNSYYCTPNKLFEFIQAEVPIIANKSPELIYFVEKQNFGINMPMKSSRQIARAIDKAFSSGKYGLWKANIKLKKHYFSWNQEEEKYISVIKQLIK
jgi:glycosyltransferase involved in cell wall biosynthesis/ubiquinone/menaquinone biosynthesis C-methylase UbiE